MTSSTAPIPDGNRTDLPGSWESWLAKTLYHPVDIAFLVYFRVVFGLTMLWHAGSFLFSGAVKEYYVRPVFHFTYLGFEWVRPWPGALMHVHFCAMAVLAVFLILGFWYRLSAVLFFLTFTYTFLLEKALYQNHYYLICLLSFLLIFLPAHRACSFDAMDRPWLRMDCVPAWTFWLLRFQIGIPYFFGGIAKLNHDWLRGEPMRMGLGLRTHYPIVGPYFSEEWMVWFFAYGGIAFDLLVVPALFWRRTRVPAYIAAVAFHLMNSQMFDIGIFPPFMILATAIFFRPDWPRRLFSKRRSAPAFDPAPPVKLTPTRKIALGCAGVWLAVQLLLPLRQYLYPGETSWTEYGHRFAWRMMLRAKDCPVRFHITNPATGRTGTIDLRPYLTQWQVEKLGREPDMLIEFSQFLAEDLRKKGYPDVEVRGRC